jgi:acyl-CoA thioester hydrolase
MDGWLEVAVGRVGPETIDYNGHMNVVHYRAAFDASTDGLFAHLGLGPEQYTARTGATLMVVEEHTRYHAELSEGERYRILARLVGHSAKKLHYLLAMENLDRGVLAATHEELALHVDLTARRSTPLPAAAPWPPSRPWRPLRPGSRPRPTWAGSSPRDQAPRSSRSLRFR